MVAMLLRSRAPNIVLVAGEKVHQFPQSYRMTTVCGNQPAIYRHATATDVTSLPVCSVCFPAGAEEASQAVTKRSTHNQSIRKPHAFEMAKEQL